MMTLAIVLTVVSQIAIAAHFLRDIFQPAGVDPLALAGLLGSLVAPLLLLSRRRWALYANQALLAVGAFLWLGTAGEILAQRVEAGRPYLRMVAILGGVALVALSAAVLLALPKVRTRFR